MKKTAFSALKSLFIVLLGLCLFTDARAETGPQLSLKISGDTKNNAYYLCIYGVGCLSIQAAAAGKVFQIAAMDMGNIQKFVITDSRTMTMYAQDSSPSCNVKVEGNQKITITGQLQVNASGARVEHLRCAVS